MASETEVIHVTINFDLSSNSYLRSFQTNCHTNQAWLGAHVCVIDRIEIANFLVFFLLFTQKNGFIRRILANSQEQISAIRPPKTNYLSACGFRYLANVNYMFLQSIHVFLFWRAFLSFTYHRFSCYIGFTNKKCFLLLL